ncbi:MAG: hypothetical protein JW782_01145 [Candidatus Saganbacteria bacterium]|nr:hypothetical protein [Candidatus Saganbacteria bacterium]
MEYFKAFFAVKPSQVRKVVILSPIVYPKQFEKMSGLKGRQYKSILGYLIADFKAFTYIKTPMTQAAIADLVVLLKKTKCREVYFIGAVGGLEPGVKIGDILVTDRARDVFSFSSMHDETPKRLKSLRGKGVLGIDFETKAFFSAAKKTGLKALAAYVVTDLPFKKPFYKKKTKREEQRIKDCLAYIVRLLAATAADV